MKFSTVAVAVALNLPLVAQGASWHRAAAHRVKYLGARSPARIIPRDKESQQEYDEETTSFQQQGLCRAYMSTTDIQKSLSTCAGKCGDLVKQANDSGNVTSVSCVSAGQTLEQYTDPSGDVFTMGECECNIPILDDIVQDVLMALPAIAEIGCELLFDSLDLVLQIGAAAIPGEGEAMDAGMAAAVKAAKTVTENGQDASSFLQWFANPCGSSNYTQKIDQIFDPLSNVPDSVMPGLGCKKKPCPGPKPKESGAKGPDESAPVTKASDTSKPTSDSATKASSTDASTTSKPSDSGSASAGPSKASSTAASTSGPTSQPSSSGSAASTSSSIPGSTVAPTTTIVPTTTESPTVETNSGSCTAEPDATLPASGVDKRAPAATGSADSFEKRAPVAFCFKYEGVPPPPQNTVPSSMACVNKLGQVAHYSSSMTSAAIQQGARYKLGSQVIGSQKYPHTFANTAGVDDVTIDPACQGKEILEFPILNSGILPSGGRNALQDPGTDRVLFTVTDDPGQTSTQYCGLMTHNRATPAGSSLQPFGDCVEDGR